MIVEFMFVSLLSILINASKTSNLLVFEVIKEKHFYLISINIEINQLTLLLINQYF